MLAPKKHERLETYHCTALTRNKVIHSKRKMCPATRGPKPTVTAIKNDSDDFISYRISTLNTSSLQDTLTNTSKVLECANNNATPSHRLPSAALTSDCGDDSSAFLSALAFPSSWLAMASCSVARARETLETFRGRNKSLLDTIALSLAFSRPSLFALLMMSFSKACIDKYYGNGSMIQDIDNDN